MQGYEFLCLYKETWRCFWLHIIYTSIDIFSCLGGNFKVISRTSGILYSAFHPNTSTDQNKKIPNGSAFVRDLNGNRILANSSALLLRLTGEHLQGPNGLQMPIYPSGRMTAVVSVLEKNEPMLLWRLVKWHSGAMWNHSTPIVKLPFVPFSLGIALIFVLHMWVIYDVTGS